MIRRPPRSTQSRSSAASDVYKRQAVTTREPGPRLVLTQAGTERPASTAFLARSPAAIMTEGLEVLVQLVKAAITTAPSRRANSSIGTASFSSEGTVPWLLLHLRHQRSPRCPPVLRGGRHRQNRRSYLPDLCSRPEPAVLSGKPPPRRPARFDPGGAWGRQCWVARKQDRNPLSACTPDPDPRYRGRVSAASCTAPQGQPAYRNGRYPSEIAQYYRPPGRNRRLLHTPEPCWPQSPCPPHPARKHRDRRTQQRVLRSRCFRAGCGGQGDCGQHGSGVWSNLRFLPGGR